MLNPCKGCRAKCCSGYLVTVTGFDVLRISARTGLKPGEFACFYPATILNLDWDSVLHFHDSPPTPGFFLLALKSWPCVFLEQGKCRIHGFAPGICSRYPYDRQGNLVARHCSLLSRALFYLKGPGTGTIMDEIRDYNRIVRKWNMKKGAERDCMDFLLKMSADFKEYSD